MCWFNLERLRTGWKPPVFLGIVKRLERKPGGEAFSIAFLERRERISASIACTSFCERRGDGHDVEVDEGK